MYDQDNCVIFTTLNHLTMTVLTVQVIHVSFIHSFVRLLFSLIVQLFARSFVHSYGFFRLFILSLVRVFVCSIVHNHYFARSSVPLTFN